MKTPMRSFSGLLLILTVAGCTSVKRFKSAEYKGEDHNLVMVDLFGSSLDHSELPEHGRNLWDLSASAQTQFIQILNIRYPENGQFRSALNQEYMMEGKTSTVDLTRSNLQMVFTISRTKDYTVLGEKDARFSPADRIESLKFSLRIPDQYNLAFTGWNRYASEYGEIEIADVSFSKSFDLSGDVSTAYIDGGFRSNAGRKEEQAIRSRYLKLNGRISPGSIHLEAEGSREIDLAGNILAEVSLAFEGFPEKVCFPVYSSTGESAPYDLSRLDFVDMLVPRISDLPGALMATLEMEYIYRHVESGWKSYQEWDDRVAYYKGAVSKQVKLFERSDYVPLLYCLGSDSEGKEALKLRSSSGMEYPLQFMGYAEAQRFLDWLQDMALGYAARDPMSPIKAGTSYLIWEGESLKPGMLGSLILKVMPVY